MVVAGEITVADPGAVDYDGAIRAAIRSAGYTDGDAPFNADDARIRLLLTRQAREIEAAVGTGAAAELGAGDQGLRPDGKTQVTVDYRDGRPVAVTDVVVSTQHEPGALERVRAYLTTALIPRVLGAWWSPDIRLTLNPAGAWTVGGPEADAGLTGRKTIVDSYGGIARHGGGAFSGKDPTKVDRSGAYFCRWLARRVVAAGLAERAEIQVSYAIGRAEPVSVSVETFGTGDARAAADLVRSHDFRPRAIIERLGLARPIYRQTTNYGHFGRAGLPWEDRS